MIKKNEKQYITLFSFHHTLLDGWSTPIILNFVNDIYIKLINNENIFLNNDDDFDNFQNYLQSTKNKNYDYWNKKLHEIEDKNDLKVLKNNQSIKDDFSKEFNNEYLEIKGDNYLKLKNITLSYGLTLNALFQFIWHKILNIYSNSKQTIIGTTISGRNIPVKNIENVVGCFINTLPLIVDHQNDGTNLIDKIKEIQDNINEININSNAKLSKLQKNGEKLFEIILVFENYPEIKNDKINELNIKFIKSIEKLDNDINIIIYEDRHNKKISIGLNYILKLFDQSLIKDTIKLFDHILNQIIDNPNQKVSDLKKRNNILSTQIILDNLRKIYI